jgi:Skp family chaperone for outer membrane proteins
MTNFLKAALLGSAAALALSSAPAMAQRGGATPAPAAQAAPVVVVANTDAAIVNTNAYRAAVQQIQATYAAQIQQVQARRTALEAELRPLQQAAVTEQSRQPRNQAAYETAVRTFQTRQQAAEAELGRLGQPVQLAQEYAAEQISLRVSEAFETARRARGANIVLRVESVLTADDSANITQAIVNELNRLVPAVQIVPPAGYQPGALVRAQQQQAAAAQPGAAPAPAPAPTPAPAAPQTR